MKELREKIGGLYWSWIAVVVIVLDQITKYLATEHLVYHRPVNILPFFNFTLAHNKGAAFSFLNDASGWQRWFFTVIALGVSVFIVVWLKKLGERERWLAIALSLVLGGALGNVWDRIFLGYVIDFLDVFYGSWHWPAFNIADSAISIGATMLIIEAFFFKKPEENETKGARTE